jgi:arylsulfatase A-like enzyme
MRGIRQNREFAAKGAHRRRPASLLFVSAAAIIVLLAFLSACVDPKLAAVPIRGVVLVSIDALGAKHVGAYGYRRDTTPTLDALAADGALFERTYTNQSWTLTSHITMMSGLYAKTHGASPHSTVRPGVVMLAEALSREGFATAAFTGAAGFMNPEFGLGRGFDVYGTEQTLDGAQIASEWLAARAAQRAVDPEHRFFLFVHFYDLHSDGGTSLPYDSPPEFRERFFPQGLAWNRRGDTRLLLDMQAKGDFNDADREVLRGLYDASALFTDTERLAPLLRTLTELDLDEDTLVIVTSDHGEELFEHGRAIHHQPYEEVARVPLVMRGPGIPKGERITRYAELVDLMPTVLDALSLPIPESVQGESLLPILRGNAPITPGAYIDGLLTGYGDSPSGIARDLDGVPWTFVSPIRLVASDGVRTYRLRRRQAALFRLDRDPEQRVNLAATETAIAKELGRALLDWYEDNEAAGQLLGTTSARTIISEKEREQLRNLGYVE